MVLDRLGPSLPPSNIGRVSRRGRSPGLSALNEDKKPLPAHLDPIIDLECLSSCLHIVYIMKRSYSDTIRVSTDIKSGGTFRLGTLPRRLPCAYSTLPVPA